MDLNNSFSSDKSRHESARIPSPASVSSVHSIRPLEWDSGADIGYELKHQSGLSTVERIALKSGTVNLLESCITRDTSADCSYSRKYIGNPLAQSSPFAIPVKVDTASSDVKKHRLVKPLVDYSISGYSFDEKVESFESKTPKKVDVFEKADRVSKLRSNENSKSLDDLRYLERGRRTKTGSGNRSRSSQNLLLTVPKNGSEKNSSSSLATLIPSVEEFSRREYSNKSVQVDEACLIMDRVDNVSPPKSSLEFFRKICNEESNDNGFRNTHSKNSTDNDEESVDGGSFEYVPGSRYASQTLESKLNSDVGTKDATSVNTSASEVTDGVALLTKYVNDLKVSNKRQVIEKVAKSLMNNLCELSKLRKSSSKVPSMSSGSNVLLNSSPAFNAASFSYSKLCERNSIESDFHSSKKCTNSQSSKL